MRSRISGPADTGASASSTAARIAAAACSARGAIARVDDGERPAGPDLVADALHVGEADAVVDAVLDPAAAAAERQHGEADARAHRGAR